MKMRTVWNTKFLLALALFVGVLNLSYLHLFVVLSANSENDQLQENTRVLRRQIASVDPGIDTEQKLNIANHNYLEMLNLDISDAFERYQTSKNTVAKQYKDILGTRVHEDVVQMERGWNGDTHVGPSCTVDPFLLIEIHSNPENFMSRESIRLTWGRQENAINQGTWTTSERSWKTIFLVGKHRNAEINELILQEARVYGDIVIGDFKDSFRNLSKKMLLSIRWPLNHCKARYILKTDEDCYVNVLSLLEWLVSYDTVNGSQPLYAGKVQRNMEAIRDKNDRYFVSRELYPYRTYPNYVSGGGYVFSGNLLEKLAQVSKEMPLFSNEDACLGTFMHRLGIKPRENLRFLPFIYCDIDAPEPEENLFQRPLCHFLGPLVIHGVTDIRHIQIHYNVMLMTFAPTICLYIEKQSYTKRFPRLC